MVLKTTSFLLMTWLTNRRAFTHILNTLFTDSNQQPNVTATKLKSKSNLSKSLIKEGKLMPKCQKVTGRASPKQGNNLMKQMPNRTPSKKKENAWLPTSSGHKYLEE